MSEPEIARRCRECGAAIRDQAFFCPQCGKELPNSGVPKGESAEGGRDTGDYSPSGAAITEPLTDSRPSDVAIPAGPSQSSAPVKQDNLTEPIKPAPQMSRESSPARGIQMKAARRIDHAPGKVRDKIQRATTLARDVEGDVKHRVQKVREISNVVIDEAAYDPSLRFILIAAVLFVLFLVIVLLNKLIS